MRMPSGRRQATLYRLLIISVSLFFANYCAIGISACLQGWTDTITNSFILLAKAKPQYVTKTSSGGKWTIAMVVVSFLLVFSEFQRWWKGNETHTFAVEKNIGYNLQINLDIVMKMRCEDIHINVQDAAGDRILAGEMLKKDPTNWHQWVDGQGIHSLGKDAQGRLLTGEGFHGHDEGFGQEHVHDIVAHAGGWRRQKFAKTPRLKGGRSGPDSCRMFGSLEVNKVQGDFHITARGHGYQEYGASGHLDHNSRSAYILSEKFG